MVNKRILVIETTIYMCLLIEVHNIIYETFLKNKNKM